MAPEPERINECRRSKSIEFVSIESASKTPDGQFIEVEFSNQTRSLFPVIWLKDNEPTEQNFCNSKTNKTRKRHIRHLDLQIEVTSIELSSEKNSITICWSDGSRAEFSAVWLQKRNFSRSANPESRLKNLYFDARSQAKLWTSNDLETQKEKISFEWNEIMDHETSLHDALMSLLKWGILFVKNSPKCTGALKSLTNHIGHARSSHNGTFFQLMGKVDASHIGQLPLEVGFHTDHAQLSNSPDVVALHCIQQAAHGGNSIFCDAFEIARQIQENHPEEFKILCETEIEYVGWGTDAYKFHFVNRIPIFKFNEKTQLVEKINFEDDRRNWFLNAKAQDVPKIYRSIKLFVDLCYNEQNLLRARLESGDMVLFLNNRVMHGREAYQAGNTDSASGAARHLEGCEFTLDVIGSKIRDIREKLGTETIYHNLI